MIEDFDFEFAVNWTAEHSEVPILFVSLYLVFIFNAPAYIPKDGFQNLGGLLAVWNLFLAFFSIGGALCFMPLLLNMIQTKGFFYTICEPSQWYTQKDAGFWLTVFVYSKYLELIDTVFLILRGKKVIFLHWFHHITVLLYCMHAFALRVSCGVWFCTMNYAVHSIMYTYFFLSKIGLHKQVSVVAPFITFIQIAQMIGGLIVLAGVGLTQITSVPVESLGWKQSALNVCETDPANWKMGLMMYSSYFFLFVQLFSNKYCSSKKKIAKNKNN